MLIRKIKKKIKDGGRQRGGGGRKVSKRGRREVGGGERSEEKCLKVR